MRTHNINDFPHNRLCFDTMASSPVEESCVQVDSHDPSYLPVMKAECAIFARQLERMFPAPKGCYFGILRQPHDFGEYMEVAAFYPREKMEECAEWSINAQDHLPLNWDEEAQKELEAKNLAGTEN